MPQQVKYLLAHVLQLEPEVHEDLGGYALLLSQEAEQQVFRADVVMVEVARLFDGILDDLLGPRRLRQLAHGHHVRPGLDDLLDFQPDLPQINVQVLENIGGDARPFFNQAQKDMLGPDVFVVEALGLLIGQLHYFASPIRKALIHSCRLRLCPSSLGVVECAMGGPRC